MATRKDNPGPKNGPPTLPTIGKELRAVVERLEGIQSHVVVCSKALEEQNGDNDFDVAAVLRLSVSFPIQRHRQRLAKLASKCDGKSVGDCYVDENETEGGL